MDDLFRLYRYLATSQKKDDDTNPYTRAYRALEQVVDLLSELDYWGRYLREHGGFMWEEADKITERIILQHKTGLCAAAGDDASTNNRAILDFVATHTDLEDIDELISSLRHRKRIMLEAKARREEDEESEARAEQERIFFWDSGEAIEDQ